MDCTTLTILLDGLPGCGHRSGAHLMGFGRTFVAVVLLALAGCGDQFGPALDPCAAMIALALVLDERGQIVEERGDAVTIEWTARRTVATFEAIGNRCAVRFIR